MARQQLAAELTLTGAIGRGTRRAFDYLDSRVGKAMRGFQGFNQEVAGLHRADRAVRGLGRGIGTLATSFRGTNEQIGRTHDVMRTLQRRSREVERSMKAAAAAGRDTTAWEKSIDRLNAKLERQEHQLTRLRRARERFDRAGSQFRDVRERVGGGVGAIGRRAGYAGVGAAIAGGYATAQAFEKFTEFDNILSTLRAEGVAQGDIPAISDEILRFASETRFTALEIGQLLVAMKKDGQEITSELAGFGDLLKFAVAENKDINTAWDVTRTYINSTNTELRDALKLQEELSNATSLSKLQIEDYGEIAGKALSIFSGLQNWDTRGFNAAAGFLADMGVQTETVGITLRQLPIILANAAEGTLGKEKQGVFDALGISIADSKGELRDFITVLNQFRTAFRQRGLITEEGRITTPGIAVISEIFDKRYANAVGRMISGVDDIERSMQGVGRVGTLDEKFAVHSETLFAAVKRFESARESLGLRIMMTMNQDENFIRMFDGLTAKTGEFIQFVKDNSEEIAALGTAVIDGFAWIGENMLTLGGQIFNYFQERGPALKAFFTDLWEDSKEVWATLRPVVMGVVGGLRTLFDAAGNLAGGNTKLVAWLASAYVGFKLLNAPVLALKSGFNLVLGTIDKVRAAWTGLDEMRTPKPLGDNRWGTPAAEGAKRGGIFGRLKGLKPVVGSLFSKLVQFGPMLVGLFAKLGFLVPLIKGIAIGVVAALGTVTAPVWGIIAAVTAAIVGLTVLIVKNWDKVKLAVTETWDTIKLFGDAVWETLKWVGGSVTTLFGNMFANIDLFLQKFGINITGVFTQLGDWFKGLFSGIWNAIRGVGQFLSDQFGNLLGWIASLNDTFQEFITGWRDFFKERNERREGVAGIKVELPALDETTKALIRERRQQPAFEMDMPAVDSITMNIENPPAIEPLTMNVERPDIPSLEIEKPTMPNLNVETPEIPSMDLDAQQRRFTPRATSVEFVDFAGVDEIAQINRAGFDSILGINDQILTAIKARHGILTDGSLPVLNTPPIQTELPGLDVPRITPPEALVNVPEIKIPEPQVVNIEVPTLSGPNVIEQTQGERIEENITFNVYQQPGEDAVELTDRIMDELQRRQRTGYYE